MNRITHLIEDLLGRDHDEETDGYEEEYIEAVNSGTSPCCRSSNVTVVLVCTDEEVWTCGQCGTQFRVAYKGDALLSVMQM